MSEVHFLSLARDLGLYLDGTPKWGFMNDFKYSEWTTRYSEAILEVDKEKLAQRVREAENAMLSRCLELRKSPGDYREGRAIEAALSHLKALKGERLNFHDQDNADDGSLSA